MNNLKKGQVIKNISGKVTVLWDDEYFDCVIRGRLKKDNQKILVGDYCIFDKINKTIEEILPRKNQLTRPSVANIDQIVIFVSSQPEADLSLVDKLIISADINDIKTLLLINKDDLLTSEFIEKIKEQYSGVVSDIIISGTVTKNGIDSLKKALKNKFSAFIGQSGVGKSSILNMLFPQLNLPVGELSQKNLRGRHTTRHSEIYIISGGGAVIDTPGFNLFDFKDIKHSDLSRLYVDIDNYAKFCKYRSCNHIDDNLVDCGVIEALNCGKINRERYNRYKDLYKILKTENDKKYV